MFVFKIFTTQTTTKLFVVRVYQLMTFQFMHCIETLWTSTAYIWLYGSVSM